MLASIYVARVLEPTLAQQVARQSMAHGALGAALALAVEVWAPQRMLIVAMSAAALAFLGLLGGMPHALVTHACWSVPGVSASGRAGHGHQRQRGCSIRRGCLN